MQPAHRQPAANDIPEPLAPVCELATNLRWSWHRPTEDLFNQIGRRLRCGVPTDVADVRPLDEVGMVRLTALTRTKRIGSRIDDLVLDLRDYLHSSRWYQVAGEMDPTLPASICYFSLDLDLADLLNNDSNPLSTLAGDHLKAASDLGVPLIAVGLDYRSDRSQLHRLANPVILRLLARCTTDMPRRPLTDDDGQPVLVYVDLPNGRTLWARIWQVALGRVPLLLLDTDIDNNEPGLRNTSRRHSREGDVDHRLHQDLLIGLGGPQAVRAFCDRTSHPHPEIVHCDGDRTAFVGLERIRELIDEGRLEFEHAMTAVRESTIFTSQVSDRTESYRYHNSIIRKHLKAALLDQLPLGRILHCGGDRDSDVFNPTDLGMRLARRSTTVSSAPRKPGKSWLGTSWPGCDVDRLPPEPVAPGVHGPSWEAPETKALIQLADWDEIGLIADRPTQTDQQLWHWRGALRGQLIRAVRERVRADWVRRGSPTRSLDWVSRGFTQNGLTIGLACDARSYQSLGLLLWHPEWLRSLVLDDQHPVNLIVLISPGNDDAEPVFLDKIQWMSDDIEFRDHVAFVPGHEPLFNRLVHAGCDVWLNEPRANEHDHNVFGMRAALNGTLNIAFEQSWWPQPCADDVGWVVPIAGNTDRTVAQIDLQALALFDLLAREVIPEFYQSTEGGIPNHWIGMVRRTLVNLRPEIQASRMVTDYVENYYGPAATASRSDQRATRQPEPQERAGSPTNAAARGPKHEWRDGHTD